MSQTYQVSLSLGPILFTESRPGSDLFEELGVDVDAVGGGGQRFDGPGRVQGVDPDVQRVHLLRREHLVPRGTQLEQTLPGVFVDLRNKTQELGPKTTTQTAEKYTSNFTSEMSELQRHEQKTTGALRFQVHIPSEATITFQSKSRLLVMKRHF